MELKTSKKERLDKSAKLPNAWAQNILDNIYAVNEYAGDRVDLELEEIIKTKGSSSPGLIAASHVLRLTDQLRKKLAIPEEQPIDLQLLTDTGIIEQELPKGKRAAWIFTGATNYGILRVFGERVLPKGSEAEPVIEKQFTPDYGLTVIAENATRFTLSQTISERRAVILAVFE